MNNSGDPKTTLCELCKNQIATEHLHDGIPVCFECYSQALEDWYNSQFYEAEQE
jgi:hypothetical protein